MSAPVRRGRSAVLARSPIGANTRTMLVAESNCDLAETCHQRCASLHEGGRRIPCGTGLVLELEVVTDSCEEHRPTDRSLR